MPPSTSDPRPTELERAGAGGPRARSEHRVPRADLQADVVVIGAGPTGENVAQYATAGGLDVVIVEGELLGGECSYFACMPSKALLHPVEVSTTTTLLGGVTDARVEPAGLMRRRDEWVSHYEDAGQVQWAESAGIRVLRGHARLAGERLVHVQGADTEHTVAARRAVVIATGSVPAIPGEFDGVHPWTSRDATGVREVPRRLVIVGGGVVAVEAATWMAALGAEVTLLARGDRLLAAFEPVAGAQVAEGLRRAGVDVRCGVSVAGVQRADARDTGLGLVHGGPVTLQLTGSGASGARDRGSLEADEVLVATGRRPRLDDVGLDAVGLTSDDVLQGSLPGWLHAIGDAGGAAPLTHRGKYDARVLGSRLAGTREGATPPVVPTPQVVFTDPQVASVGLTEGAARAAGADVVVSRVAFSSAAGASLLRDEVPGEACLVVDGSTGLLLGTTFVGPLAGELVHAATVAIVGGVPVSVLRHAIPSYPTASELWLRLLEQLPARLR